MSRIPNYGVDAFADEVGRGNPAAVCTLPEWLSDEVLRGVADGNGVAVSARGDQTDFVSRYFAPGYVIPEDPVTGSTRWALGSHGSRRLDRAELDAVQLSARGGRIGVRCEDDRVHLAGSVACYLTGAICCLPSGRRRA